MNKNIRLQKLRDFTVQIRTHVDSDEIVGTGFVVSTKGEIVTCRHVVEQATRLDPRCEDKVEVGVYFPQKKVEAKEKKRRAIVTKCFSGYDDDVVLLELMDGPSPLAPEQVAILGQADENSIDHRFRSYGYRRRDNYIAGRASGVILGDIELPEEQRIQVDPLELRTQEVDHGMSGAAVLDIETNLVVGIISETWNPRLSDTPDANRDLSWAVNARVLRLPPLVLSLQDAPFEKRPSQQPNTDRIERIGPPKFAKRLQDLPTPLGDEWVGRAELLEAISTDWSNPNRRVTGLIGFGGEGKSSLVYRWLDNLLFGKLQNCSISEGVFWWNFYEKPNVDEFFEAALIYLSGERIKPRDIPSTNARMNEIAWELRFARYLFVLDGLEVMQHQSGDQYGLLQNADLRQFLQYLAAVEHDSFCLVTSRIPLFELEHYSSYKHRDVNRLSQTDGVLLLRHLQVKGADEALKQLVESWEGHALTLSLLARDMIKRYNGKLEDAKDLPLPQPKERLYQRLNRVLRRYDDHLTEAERTFMTIFSAFRIPVHESAIERVFGDAWEGTAQINRLKDYCLLRYNSGYYTSHALIGHHYRSLLNSQEQTERKAIHKRIKEYYLARYRLTLYPTLDDLAPAIEAVHHACSAKAYDEAEKIRVKYIYRYNRKVIIYQLGAYETNLDILQQFFPTGDTSQDPLVSKPADKSTILNEVGLCLMSLGRLDEADSFYRRSNQIARQIEEWESANVSDQNLTELYISLGALSASAESAHQALTSAYQTDDKQRQILSLASKGWIAHLRGDLESASTTFQKVETWLKADSVPYLYSLPGIWHATHLERTGKAPYARQITEVNLRFAKSEPAVADMSRCHRLLAHLDSHDGHHDSAQLYYNEAVKIARSISERAVLIEALLARGCWRASQKQVAPAHNDLDEALNYALDGGYRIYEADIRIGLAWAHLAGGDVSTAQAQAEKAWSISEEMGYYWGQVDAKEVLEKLRSRG